MGKIFSFDVESDGLYGEGFAVGAVVLNENGEEIDRFTGIAEKEKVENNWVKENVLPNLEGLREYKTRKEMRDEFWNFYMNYKSDSICVVDVGFPVEARFLQQVIQDDLENRQWNGPYPLYDVSSVLHAKGIDPDINRIEYSGLRGLKQHNPADDALASAFVFLKAMYPKLKLKEEIKREKEIRKQILDFIQENIGNPNNPDSFSGGAINAVATVKGKELEGYFDISPPRMGGHYIIFGRYNDKGDKELYELKDIESVRFLYTGPYFKLKEGKKMENVLEISKLAEELEKKPVKRTLPNGKEVEQIVWTGEDLVKLSQIMHNKHVPEGMHVKINGAAPAWLVASITHELHPNSVSVNSPDGYVPIGMKKPSGTGGGENLKWSVLKNKDWHIVHVEQNDPSVPLNPKDLDNAFPPELPMGSKVILSGRMPNWLAASATMAYHGTTKAVALYQPGTGATVAMTHSQSVKLGEVIPEHIVKEAKPVDELEKGFDNIWKRNDVSEEKGTKPVGELEKELNNLERIDVAEEKTGKGLKI